MLPRLTTLLRRYPFDTAAAALRALALLPDAPSSTAAPLPA